MSGTVLSDEIVNIVGQLSDLQSKKDELHERIQLYENKLNMAREASLALTNEEQELASQLQARGFFYGQGAAPVNAVPVAAPVTGISPTSGMPPGAQDQLAALLSTLFQQQAPTSMQQPLPQPPQPQTSIGSFGNGIYNFPSPTSSGVPLPPPGPNRLAPTSGPVPIRAVPKTSPTSAPGISIRR